MPALALTALATDDDRQRSLAAGFQMHLTKPVDIDRLSAAVVELAARPHRERVRHGRRERDARRTYGRRRRNPIPPRCSRSCGTPSPRCSAPPPPPRSCGARPGGPRRTARSSSTSSSVARSSNTATRCRTTGRTPPGRQTPSERTPLAFRALVAEIGRLLVELTGTRLHRPARADPRASHPRAGVAGGGGELSAARPRLPCLSTGSAAFDEILGGGCRCDRSTSSRASRASGRRSSCCRCCSSSPARGRSACT